jgi:tRNA A-37 threonylcarbamoyl transferase component Bud32
MIHLKKNNLYHNDLHGQHIRVKNNKIYIIDFDLMRSYNRKRRLNRTLQYNINYYK